MPSGLPELHICELFIIKFYIYTCLLVKLSILLASLSAEIGLSPKPLGVAITHTYLFPLA